MPSTSDDDPPPPAPPPPPPPQHRSPWSRVWAALLAERLPALFTAVLAAATVLLVVTAIFQQFGTVDALEATNRLAIASENAAADRRQALRAYLGVAGSILPPDE